METYSFSKHLHNFACWTAARAVQRGFTTTENIVRAIESTELRDIVANRTIDSEEDFDRFHKKCCNQLKDCFEEKNIDAFYGRMAKIVAIYLKTSVVIRDSGENKLATIVHPPIDSILLKNLHADYPELNVKDILWTKMNEDEYFDLVGKLRTLKFKRFWELEIYWRLLPR